MAIDGAGILYASDQFGGRVQIFAPDGTFQTESTGVGTDYGPFSAVGGVVIYRGTTLFVVDFRHQRVLKFKLLPPLGSG